MKNIKTIILGLCLFASNAFADVTIDHIKYSLDQSSRTATVTGAYLTNVVVPYSIVYDGVTYYVTKIGRKAFYNSGIKSIKTENSIRRIEEQAFDGASSLEKVDFGNEFQYIDSYAFKNCSALKYIVLPELMWDRGTEVFLGCSQLSIICLKEGFNTGYNNQTIYPSSFFTFSPKNNSVFSYSGNAPVVYYTFNGIGNGFQPTYTNWEGVESTVGTHTAKLACTIANEDMSFDVEIPYTYKINPITLTAKVKDASRLYGDADPQYSSTYTGFVNGENESVITSHGNYSTTATAKSDVGTYTITQSGATAQNYLFTYESGTLTVNKAPLTITANDKTMTYGGNVPTLDARYEGLKNNETKPAWITTPSITTTATKTSNVGTYPITISNAEAKNYYLTINNGTLTIEKAPLMVTANNKIRTYGDENPEFTLSYSGLKNGETIPEWQIQPTIETTATVSSPVGTYPINVKDAVAVNYNITAVAGTLTINKAALQIKPNDAIREYGQDNPQFELSYIGLKNNESAPEWITEPVITTNATRTSSVGQYAIQVASAEAKNYTLDKRIGILTITKAPITVGVNSYSRKYGEANPTFGLHYDGLLNGETEPEWTTLPTITTEAVTTSGIGEYTITANGGEMKNYATAEITPGVLTITPASLTIKAVNASRQYFEDNPEFSFTCTGFIGSDNVSVLTSQPQITTSATKNSKVGVYPIEISGAESANYNLNYENGLLTINKRALTVTTNNYTRAYGEENPTFELFYTGFVNNENENVLLSKPKATTVADANTDVGVYDITIGDGVAENYDFTYVGGILTIEKAYQTLTWEQEFSEVKPFDQVELQAVASSGLAVTYTVESGSGICSVTKIGSKHYLDCTGEGDVVLSAMQAGNNNFWQTTKIYKQFSISSSSGINTVVMDIDEDTKIYDISGNQISTLQRGVNIIKWGDGSVKKVFVK